MAECRRVRTPESLVRSQHEFERLVPTSLTYTTARMINTHATPYRAMPESDVRSRYTLPVSQLGVRMEVTIASDVQFEDIFSEYVRDEKLKGVEEHWPFNGQASTSN